MAESWWSRRSDSVCASADGRNCVRDIERGRQPTDKVVDGRPSQSTVRIQVPMRCYLTPVYAGRAPPNCSSLERSEILHRASVTARGAAHRVGRDQHVRPTAAGARAADRDAGFASERTRRPPQQPLLPLECRHSRTEGVDRSRRLPVISRCSSRGRSFHHSS